jgi:hypothetical protein
LKVRALHVLSDKCDVVGFLIAFAISKRRAGCLSCLIQLGSSCFISFFGCVESLLDAGSLSEFLLTLLSKRLFVARGSRLYWKSVDLSATMLRSRFRWSLVGIFRVETA